MNFSKQLITNTKSTFLKSTLIKIASLNFTRYLSKIISAKENDENLIVKFEDREEAYPVVWLRDNCTCKECYHEHSQSRILIWKDFHVEPKINQIKVMKNESIQVTWNGDHKSIFNADWLIKRSFKSEVQTKYLEENYQPKRNLWDKTKFNSVLKTYSYHEIMKNGEVLRNWLLDLAVNGVTVLDGAPSSLHTCSSISNRVAFRRRTHYGEDFHVKSKEDTANVAYLSGLFLQLHMDLPYYRYVPGVILLHCLVQAEGQGGETLLSDGICVAEKLRLKNKEAFDILSNVDVNWYDIGEEDEIKFHKIYRTPVISLNSHGKIEEIRYSTPQRDSYFSTDIKNVPLWYKSLKLFTNMLFENMVEIKLKPGQVLAFDNTRIAHGRQKYEDSPGNQRHLVGNYLDWDEIFSTIRVLKSGIKQS